MHKSKRNHHVGIKADPVPAGSAKGDFQAVVSVFDVVDFDRDVVKPGAFGASIERIKSLGEPFPVVYSHRHSDVEAVIGKLPADGLAEVGPGHELLPEKAKEFGGLVATGSIDLTTPMGKAAHTRMVNRTVREWSYAYDITKASFGTQDDRPVQFLEELDVWEVGPTLFGANNLTDTIAVKAAKGQITEGKMAEFAEWMATIEDSLLAGGLSDDALDRLMANDPKAVIKSAPGGLAELLDGAAPGTVFTITAGDGSTIDGNGPPTGTDDAAQTAKVGADAGGTVGLDVATEADLELIEIELEL